MRKFIISLLLASAAASPVMAFQNDSDTAREARESRAKEEREERQKAREERRQSHEESQPAKVEAPSRPDRTERTERAHQRTTDSPVPAAVNEAPPVEGTAKHQKVDRQRIERQQVDRQRFDRKVDQGAGQPPAVEPPVDRQRYDRQRYDRQRIGETAGQATDQAQRERADVRERVDARRQHWDQTRTERLARQQEIRNQRPPVVSPTPQPGTQPPPPPATTRPSTYPTYNWSSNHWRKDRRYDWYKHRNKYWWLFQLGWYNDPFGWGYQPYGIGWRMWPSYYSSHYWLSDPWQYRLPYAPAGTRWIRYWDDAILVDLWSGQVIDVIYNFFW